MTLPEQFDPALAAVASSGGAVVAGASPHRLRCNVAQAMPLAVTFHSLELTTDVLAHSTVDELQAISQDLSNRITYLLEPIGPIEIDGDTCVVQMRSTPPSRSDLGICYYELLVQRGGSLSLRRYEKTSGNTRSPVPATVTREVLQRLVGDFCGVVGL